MTLRPILFIQFLALTLLAVCVSSEELFAIPYGSGTYGACQYSTCSIGISNTGTVHLDITYSGPATTCTVASESVSVTTHSSTGYTLTLNDNDTTNTLVSSSSTISSSTGTRASPVALVAGRWGYRIDGIGGFGAGPTSAVSSSTTIPTLPFAALPLSNAPGDVLSSTATLNSSAVVTPVWYGVCASSTQPSGTYSDLLTYSAVIN